LSAQPQTYPAPHGGLPPDPPEFPAGADPAPRWPVWYAPTGFLLGFAITLFVSAIAGVVAAAAGADLEDDLPPGLIIALTLIQTVVLCGTAVFLANRTQRPKAWHFGLRRGRFWPSIGWAVLGFVGFLVFAFVYSYVVAPEGEQRVVEDFGADRSTLALIATGFLIVVVAPIGEEFFFRGFFYKALRTRFGVLVAAALDGLVFGLVHFTGTETLELLPVLGVLGFVFCLVYERTGTLYTVIGLHALNNAIAFGVEAESLAAGLVLGSLMLAGCMFGPRLIHPRRTAAHA
jgi:hypothetical protein